MKRDRNHASVLRWSQSNEPRVAFFVNPGAGPEFDEALFRPADDRCGQPSASSPPDLLLLLRRASKRHGSLKRNG